MVDATTNNIALAVAEITGRRSKTAKCSDFANNIARELVWRHIDKGETMVGIAEAVGINASSLTRWLNGHRRGINVGSLKPLIEYLTQSETHWQSPGAADLVDSISGRILYGDGHISRLELSMAGAILRSETC